MDTVRRLFFIRHLYSRQTWLAALTDTSLVLLLSIFILQPLSYYLAPMLDVLLLLFGTVVAWWAIRKWLIIYLVSSRVGHRKYLPVLHAHTASKFSASAINDVHQQYDSIQTIAEDTDWQIFDATFNQYRQTKHGQYLARQLYYTVYEHRLTRELPNIIFDSKRSRGRQFRFRYIGSQQLSLEGSFDTYFDTYTPDFYQIDSLAFISPEVMHILIEASDYDIEITHDRLFLYGPLASTGGASRQYALGQKLATAINDNIRHYTDSYLPAGTNKTQVTAFGRQLLKSPTKNIVAATAAFVMCVAIVGASIWFRSPRNLYSDYALLAYFYLGLNTYKALEISRDNKTKTKAFLAIKNYLALHPGRK